LSRISREDRGLVGLWAADCAERVLPLFEAVEPADTRPREAIEGIRAWVRGEMRSVPLRTVALAALAAAREAGDPAAAAAARAAGSAATTAFMHAPETMGTEGHCLGAAMYAARARELAVAGRDRDATAPANATAPTGAADAEIRWALEHASAAVRELVRGLPPLGPPRGRLQAIMRRLDEGLRR
jgi:hypothetical protein